MLNPKDKLKKVPLFDEEESVINVLQRNISAIEEKRQLEAAELNDVKEEKERYKISMYSVRKYLKKYYPLHTVEECAAGNRIIINVKCITRFGMKGARVLFGGNETIHLKLHSIAKGGNKHPSHKRFIELVKESDLVDKIYSCPCHSIPLKKLISYNPARLVYVEFLREGIFKTIDPGLWDIGYPFSKPMSSELSEIIENYYKINDKKVAGNK